MHVHTHMHTHTHSRELIGWCVCVFVWEWKWGGGVEWSGCISIQQWLPVRSVWEVGRREGGMVVVVVGGAALPQSRTVRWAGTKRHDGGLLDWPGPARAPRPAKTQSTAPVQTRELAALFACLTAITPGLEQYATSSPQRSHSHTMRIHTKAMKTSLVHSVCPGGGTSPKRQDCFLSCVVFMLAGIVTTLLWGQRLASHECNQSHPY